MFTSHCRNKTVINSKSCVSIRCISKLASWIRFSNRFHLSCSLPIKVMHLSCSLLCTLLIILRVSCTPAQLLNVSSEHNVTTLLLPQNHTSALLNSINATQLDSGPEVSCSILLGRNLVLESCQNALSKIPHDIEPETFGMRFTGNFDVSLPLRFLSGMFPLRVFFASALAPIKSNVFTLQRACQNEPGPSLRIISQMMAAALSTSSRGYQGCQRRPPSIK